MDQEVSSYTVRSSSTPTSISSTAAFEQARSNKALVALKEVASILEHTDNSTLLMQEALARAMDVMAFSAGAIYLADYTGRISLLTHWNRQEGIVVWKTGPVRGGRFASRPGDEAEPAFLEPVYLSRETWEELDLPFDAWSDDIQSVLMVPLRARNSLAGVLYLVATCTLEADLVERDLLSIMGYLIANAISLSRLLVGESRARRMAGGLREVARTISSGLSLDQVLSLIVERLGDVIPFDSASVMLVNGDRFDTLFARDAQGRERRLEKGTPVQQRTTAWRVVHGGEPILLTDVRDSIFWAKVAQLDYIRSWIGIPLKLRDEVIGVLTLAKAEPGFYQPAQVPVLTAFASQAAAAIENARLYDAAQQALTERILLHEVSQAVSSSLEFDAVLNALIDAAIQATGAQRGYLVLRDNSPSALNFLAARDSARETLQGNELVVSRSIAWRVMETGEPVLTVNAQEDPRFAKEPSVINYSLRSVVCVPLVSKTRVIGALYVDNRLRDGQFTSHSLEMLNNIAAQAATAVENALLYEQLREANVRLSDALESSRQSYEQLAVAQDRLVQAKEQEVMTEMAGAAAHELNQPLTIIQSLATLLLDRQIENEDLRRDLENIALASQRVAGIVQKMVEATRYETKSYLGDQRILDLDQAAEHGRTETDESD